MTDTPEDAESERIRKWREERAAAAEEAKQERLRQAEEDRQKRLEQAEKDKQARILKAQQDREAAAAEEAERKKVEALARLPSQADLDAVRKSVTRRTRMSRLALAFQFLLFVLVPTGLITAYAALVAVPLYETQSVLVVSKAGGESNEGLGGLLGAAAGGPSNLRETFMAHEYIQSQALLDQLEGDLGTVTFLSSDALDPIGRLRDIPVLRIDKRDMFSRFVKSSINIQTGLLTLYVRMPDPDMAQTTSEVVIQDVADQINALSQTLFVERIEQAEAAVGDAQASLVEKQADLTRLQIESGEANPQARIEGVFGTIVQLEAELQTLRSRIDRARVAGQSDTFQTQQLQELEATLLARIEDQRNHLIERSSDGTRPLNSLLVDYELALLQVRIAEQILAAAITSLSEARENAALGRSQFQIVVPPNRADYAKQPNVLVTALIAFISLVGLFSVVKLLAPGRIG